MGRTNKKLKIGRKFNEKFILKGSIYILETNHKSGSKLLSIQQGKDH